MSFYKFNTAAVLAAWDDVEKQEEELRQQSKTFAALFGAVPVFNSDLTRAYLYGVHFEKSIYADPSLWTKPTEQSGFSSWPRAKAPKGMGEAHRALVALWRDQKPKIEVSREPFLKSAGLDWGMLFMTGCAYFRHGDTVYFSTGAKPDPAAGGIEILGSEYQLAKTAATK